MGERATATACGPVGSAMIPSHDDISLQVSTVKPFALTHFRNRIVSEIRNLRIQEPTDSSGETGNGSQPLTGS